MEREKTQTLYIAPVNFANIMACSGMHWGCSFVWAFQTQHLMMGYFNHMCGGGRNSNFYQPERAQARERLVLRLLYVFRVCLFVCTAVLCVRTYHVRNILRHTLLCNCMQCDNSSFGGLQAKLQQMKVVLCCLDGENLVGSRKDSGFLAYSY